MALRTLLAVFVLPTFHVSACEPPMIAVGTPMPCTLNVSPWLSPVMVTLVVSRYSYVITAGARACNGTL